MTTAAGANGNRLSIIRSGSPKHRGSSIISQSSGLCATISRASVLSQLPSVQFPPGDADGESRDDGGILDQKGSASWNAALYAAGAGRQGCTILVDPRTSKLIGPWDLTTFSALVFTALITPWEVALLGDEAPSPTTPLFVVNRIVDAIFVLDLALQFVLIYQPAASDMDGADGEWVTDPALIRAHYLRSWFSMDLVSILVSLIDIGAVAGWFGSSDSAADGGCGGGSFLEMLKLLRALRLIKLVRLTRASRMVRRWQARVALSSITTSLASCSIGILLCAHWFACAWVLQTAFTSQSPLETWLGGSGLCEPDPDAAPCEGGAAAGGTICAGPWRVYAASLYWSMMTITSIGYGDVPVTAHNAGEQLVAVLLMLTGGVIWGFVIATLIGVATTRNPSADAFRQSLDELNRFAAASNLPRELRVRLREYFHRTRHLRAAESHRTIIEQLSPNLQSEIVLSSRGRWYRGVSLFRGVPEEFLVRVTLSLSAVVFAPRELVPEGNLYVLRRGRALMRGKVYGHGCVWGEDCVLLTQPKLRQRVRVRAVDYIEVYPIAREPLLTLASEHFPSAFRKLRYRAIALAIRRGVVAMASQVLQQRRRSSSTTKRTGKSGGGRADESTYPTVPTGSAVSFEDGPAAESRDGGESPPLPVPLPVHLASSFVVTHRV